MEGKIKGFDGLRALAVISVVLTHMHIWKFLEESGDLGRAFIPLVSGGTGVKAFFILSGFLITRLLIKEHECTGTISIKKFMMRRSLRIFPLYILFLVIVTAIYIFDNNVTTWDSLLYAYFYIYNFIPSSSYTSFMGHTWSLAVEEHFYLIWPLIFFLLFATNKKVIVCLLSICIFGALIAHFYLIKNGFFDGYFIGRWTFIAGYNIAAGCLAAILLTSVKISPLIREKLKNNLWLLIGAFLYSNSLYLNSEFWFVEHVVSGYIQSTGILLMIVWLFLNQQSSLVKILEFPLLKYIGLISYGVYMYQGLFLSTGPGREPDQSWPPDQSVGFLLLLVVTPLSYHFFEKPFLRIKHRFSSVSKD